uniref:Antibiotic biosynthesis monooxygenase n=1 Tax=Phenylobacterium glaciei TaxID=2803784 RepID=A0A974P1A0_9CAUL|nr:antibiotic biosynthesis monooxygenase [Phenylobacterium glaciei]
MGEPHVLILHEVADYPAWKAVFDEAAALRKAAGELSFQVLAQDDDANRIVHFSRWTSLERARTFLSPPPWWRSAARPGSARRSSST